MRVLLIEDELALRATVASALEGIGARVQQVGDGREGLYLASEYPFDLAIVDLGLPGLPGLDVIRALRESGSHLPVLILTARGRWQEKVEGLESGADDYLVKPFEMPELLARARALWRRGGGATAGIVSAGPYRIDVDSQRVSCAGQAVELTAFEFRVLDFLVRNRERVISKHELGDYLYPQDEERDSNVLEVLIGRLRRKLDPAGQWAPIETLRGRGYRFAPRVP